MRVREVAVYERLFLMGLMVWAALFCSKKRNICIVTLVYYAVT